MKKSDFKVLIAEDDRMVRDVMVKFLEDEGYSVIVAHDGLSAIKSLRVEDVNLVLTDLRMPGADGMEVLRTAVQINPKICVVLLTAYGSLDTALEAMKEGAYDYVVKPFVMQQLLLVVRNAYNMASLIKENEELSNHLKEMYSQLESVRSVRKSEKTEKGMEAIDLLDRLEQLNIVSSDEVNALRERVVAGAHKDVLKKYSSLIDGLRRNQ